MSYENQLELAHRELQSVGIWKSNYNPPIYKLLRKLGVQVPPPFYRGFFINFLDSFIFFTAVYGSISWFIRWDEIGYTYLEAFTDAFVVGGIFSLGMSGYYKWTFIRCNLSNWETLGKISDITKQSR